MKSIRIATAQIIGSETPSAQDIRTNAKAIRKQMHIASKTGARLIQFHEGALSSYPSKRYMSSTNPDELSESDWSKVAWDVLEEELASICALARKLKLWVVLGSVHRFSKTHRPYNSSILFLTRVTLLHATISDLFLIQRCPTCIRQAKSHLYLK